MTSDIFDDIIYQTLFNSSIFKDETKLFREYVPPMLPHREKELERISQNFRPILKENNFPVNIVVSGKPGVGKTVLAKFFCEKLVKFTKSIKKKIEYQYCNCYINRTKSNILYNLLSKRYNTSCRGFEPESLLGELHTHLKHENKKLVLILDEVHILKDDILFFLQRGEMFEQTRIYYILISRDVKYNKIFNFNLSGKINDHIRLAGYSKNDLIDILLFRTKQAFKQDSVSLEIIEMIADIASQAQNARHALEILYHAGKIAEIENKKQITPEMVRRAKDYILPEITSKIIKRMKKDELLATLAISRALLINKCPDITIKESYSYYKIVCEEFNVKIKTQNMFTKYIKKLIEIGLIIQVKKPFRISLHDVPAQTLEQQLTKLLENKCK
ncbi:MAG: Cdc6/Cdc18 family protein [Candidatus Helarchaeota archaeon]